MAFAFTVRSSSVADNYWAILVGQTAAAQVFGGWRCAVHSRLVALHPGRDAARAIRAATSW